MLLIKTFLQNNCLKSKIWKHTYPTSYSYATTATSKKKFYAKMNLMIVQSKSQKETGFPLPLTEVKQKKSSTRRRHLGHYIRGRP